MTLGAEGDNAAADVSQTDDSPAALSEASRESADERYRRLLEHSPDAICVHQGGCVVYVNRAGIRWMRAESADQLVGNSITTFVDPQSIPAMLDRISGLRRQGDISRSSEAVMSRLDGTRLDVEAVSVLTVWGGEPAYQVIFRDLSAQKAAQASLSYQAALVHHASDAIIATTAAGDVTSWNPAAESVYGRIAADVLGRPVSDAVGAELNPQKILIEKGVVTDTHYAADGTARTVRVSAAAMDDGYVLLCTDQTALRRAERHFKNVVSSLDEGVLVLDHTGRVLSVNPAVPRLLGLAPADYVVDYTELAGHWIRNWEHAQDFEGLPVDPPAGPPLLRTLEHGIPFRGEARKTSASTGDHASWLAISTRRLNPEEGRMSAVLITFRDVTAERHARERLAQQALHDPLTGLPNRTHLVASVAQLREEGRLAAVLFIDLDDLKGVNDSLGHDAGDLMIKAAAQRLRTSVRADDVVCRFAGDEFVVLLVGHVDGTEDLRSMTTRVRDLMAEPVILAGVAVRMGASMGVVETGPDDDRDDATLLRIADRAMYAAKADGRRTVVFSAEDG